MSGDAGRPMTLFDNYGGGDGSGSGNEENPCQGLALAASISLFVVPGSGTL